MLICANCGRVYWGNIGKTTRLEDCRECRKEKAAQQAESSLTPTAPDAVEQHKPMSYEAKLMLAAMIADGSLSPRRRA
jgi:hypothetical protein